MSGFNLLPRLLGKARHSSFWLFVLNRLLGRMIPFNRPHGFRILELDDQRVRTGGPYRHRNLNHIRGVHACAIATVAEFSSGLMLLAKLDPARYRLIMAGLEIDYLYQAKSAIIAETVLDDGRLKNEILKPLATSDVLRKTLETRVCDAEGNLVARARITWQIKPWAQVRTQMA